VLPVFSVVKNVKTDEIKRIKVKLLKSLVSIKINSYFSYAQAHDLIIFEPNLLNLVQYSEKICGIKLFIIILIVFEVF